MRRADSGPSVQEVAGVIADLWSSRRLPLPSTAAAEIARGDDVPVWAALTLAAVVLASGVLVLRVGREASA